MCKDNEKMLIQAAENEDSTMLKALLSTGTIDINAHCEEHETPLIAAARECIEANFILILEAGADPNTRATQYNKNSPLVITAMNGLADAARALLKNPNYVAGNKKEGEDLNDEELAVFYACQHDNHELMKALVEPGTINLSASSKDHDPPLVHALNSFTTSRKQHVELLLEKGADPNARFEKDGYTALLQAVVDGRDEFVEVLLKHGADANAQDSKGNSPLTHAAQQQNQEEVVEMLIKAGAKVDLPNMFGTTALMLGAMKGFIGIVEIMLENGADINLQDKEGNTALIYAAQRNYHVVVEELLEKGADKSLKNKKRLTALKLAKQNYCDDAVALLEK